MDYQLIDADNHYYETEDCFTRHGDDEVKRFVRWVSEGKRRHLMFGDVRQTMVPNPTFNPITKPGAFHERLKELAEGGERAILGLTDPVALRRARAAARRTTATATRGCA